MTWLNYQHLLYFWHVVREGTITAACQRLRLAQPTISVQLKTFEKTLGHPLFERQGKHLALTDAGRMTYRYANEIFALGQELLDGLEGRPVEGRTPLRVGIADVVSKYVARMLLRPALRSPEPALISCFEGKPAALVASLAIHDLDLVISDSPVPPEVKLKGFNHLLGESDVFVVGTKDLARKYRRKFPQSLDAAPFLLPTPNTSLRRSLDHWFVSQGIRPQTVAEFEDTALLRVFGESGDGLFVLPAVIEEEIRQLPDITVVGRVESVRMQYYAISLGQKLKHPGVVSIVQTAHAALMG
jgi:LysR family transcriptional activator of nhaA